METVLRGWCFLNNKGNGLPESWQRFFDGQTFPRIEDDGKGEVFYLAFQGTSEHGLPPVDITLVERMAWALLCQPSLAAVIQPIKQAIQPSIPVYALALDQASLKAIDKTGYFVLMRGSEQGNAFGHGLFDALRIFMAVGSPTLVLPRPLLGDGISPIGLAHTDMGWGNAVQVSDDPWLAQRREWQPEFINPQMAINGKPDDGRITVWVAVHWLALGGAEKFAINLVRALPKDKYRILVTTDVPSSNNWVSLIQGFAEEILFLPEFLTESMFKVFAVHFIATRQIQLIHIHHATVIYAALFHIRRFFPDIKILHTLHILELPPDSGGYPENALKHCGVFIDHHHVISHHLAHFLKQRWHVPEQRMDVVYLNVDEDYFNPALVETGPIRSKHSIPSDALLVGFVGRLVRQKQPLAFISMAKMLYGRWQASGSAQPLHFVVAGSGYLLKEVELAIESANMKPFIHLHGEVVDARPVYADCDIIVLPSENEGLALVCYESMAMATPIVCTDVGAQRELVPHQLLVADGLGVDGRLADKVWGLATDAALRQKVGQLCREHILRYHRETATWAAMQNIYGRLLGETSQRLLQNDKLNGEGWGLDVLDGPKCVPNRIPVAAVVNSRNQCAGLTKLLSFLDAQGIPTFVTENGSIDGTAEAIRGKFGGVTVLESPIDLGAAGGFNCAILAALNIHSEYVLLVDGDVLPGEDCIGQLTQFLDSHDEYVFVTPAVYLAGKADILQELGGSIDFSRYNPIEDNHRFRGQQTIPPYLNVDYASDRCLLVRAEAILEVGLMDWSFFKTNHDVDWTLRLQRSTGKRGVCVTDAKVFYDNRKQAHFSLEQLYYSTRNQLYFTARFANDGCRQKAIYWALFRPIRHMVYATLIGEQDVALTLWRALRDAWLRNYGKWHDPVAFSTQHKLINADFLYRHQIKRILVDISNENVGVDIFLALQSISDEKLNIAALCDSHLVSGYCTKSIFEQIHSRSSSGLASWFWGDIAKLKYDLIVKAATQEPRYPSSLVTNQCAFWKGGFLYKANVPLWVMPFAFLTGYAIAAISAITFRRRFLYVPEFGRPGFDASELLKKINSDGYPETIWVKK